MQKRSIHLIPIVELETEAQLAIREIRNEPEVRRVMFSDHVISVNEHLLWISRLKADPSQTVFGILDDPSRRPLGVISLSALDLKNQRSDWGFYLAPVARGGGMGTAVQRRFIEFAFESLGLAKLNAAVIEGNDAVVKFYKRFGFEEEGFRKSEIVKDGTRVGVQLLGLQKETWTSNYATFCKRYESIFERFTTEIHWSTDAKRLTTIDKIEAARARNNVNWMNILRIAVEKSPVNAKQIIAEIKEIDQHISLLTAEINLEP
jgi:UDP-4-amino-4,6-dideoxy-N-acetyl-beta-L-altrosamine N-acetyltransferase